MHFAYLHACNGYFAHPFVNLVYKKNPNGVLPFLKEKCILLMSAKPRDNLPSLLSENFCQKAQKKHVTTFVTRV